ncbi:hypothetical protein [Methylobacterium sp. CM6257]
MMTTKIRRVEFAQAALDAYIHAEGADRRWIGGQPACEVVDLVTDLLLLAKVKGHDPCSVLSKAKRHLEAEGTERC